MKEEKLVGKRREEPESFAITPASRPFSLSGFSWGPRSPGEGTAQGPGSPPSLGLGAAEGWSAGWEEGLRGPLEETPRVGRVASSLFPWFLCPLSCGQRTARENLRKGSMERTGICRLLPSRGESGHQEGTGATTFQEPTIPHRASR